MNRKIFLTFAAIVAFSIGSIALISPTTLLVVMKAAVPNATALVMAQTVGVLLIVFGVLNFLVRSHETSPSLKSVLLANAFLQLLILPIDPMAYFSGTYASIGSFVPNTILHIVLLIGFCWYYLAADKELRLTPTKAPIKAST